MVRLVAMAFISLMVGATVAAAQNIDVIKERREALDAMGKMAKQTGKMLKGETDFDLAKVKEALAVFQEKSAKLPDLFPEDSKTGGDTDETKTDALPAIWDNKDDFVKRFETLASMAKDAEAGITDEFEFQEKFPKVVGNCGECHKKYRKDDK